MSENNTNVITEQTIIIKQIPQDLQNNRMYYEYESMKIETDVDCKVAGDKLIELTDRIKKVEAFKKEVLDPAKAAIKLQTESFSRILDPLYKVDEIVRTKIKAFLTSQQKKLDEEKARQLAEQKKDFEDKAKAAKVEAIQTGSQAALEVADRFETHAAKIDPSQSFQRQTMRNDQGTIAHTESWRWELVDINKVPAGFFIIDEKKLNAIARTFKKSPMEIPGIRFIKEANISVKTR